MANEGSTATDFPKYAMFRDKRVHVLYYEGDGKFRILDRTDSQWSVHRSRLTFLPEKKKTT